MSMEAVFSRIISSGAWGSAETPCGPGSTLEACHAILEQLPVWIKRFQIYSIADLGCGDWNWMSHLDLAGMEYDGYDVVRELVEMNAQKYARPGVRFHQADLTTLRIPKVDLVVCKDVLAHLPNDISTGILDAIRGSGSGMLAATTAVEWPADKRSGLKIGEFSPIDLEGPPFHMEEPLARVHVPMRPGNPAKLFALWKL